MSRSTAIRLTRHAQDRDKLLTRITAILEADPRVDAVWLSGPFGRGDADPWSDLDLYVAVADQSVEEFLVERPSLFARCGYPLIVPSDLPADNLPGGRYTLVLYQGRIQVDWNIGPSSKAVLPPASRIVFDRDGIPIDVSALAPDRRGAVAQHWIEHFWVMA